MECGRGAGALGRWTRVFAGPEVVQQYVQDPDVLAAAQVELVFTYAETYRERLADRGGEYCPALGYSQNTAIIYRHYLRNGNFNNRGIASRLRFRMQGN